MFVHSKKFRLRFILVFFAVWSMLDSLMKVIEPPDTHYLLAATGWLELGNPTEARHELEQISDENVSHPDVLEVRFDVEAAEKKWEKCAEVGQLLTKLAPKRASGYLHQAFALHELKRTREANEILEGVLNRFSRNWLVRYNLACYQCQMGHREVAWKRLEEAILLKGRDAIKKIALKDRDLEPLIDKIRLI